MIDAGESLLEGLAREVTEETGLVVGIGELVLRTAVRAAKTMGLNVAGVDLLRSNHGPVVMEVNSSPGLEGIEESTGIDVAGKIIEYIEKNVHDKSKIKDKVKG